MGFWFKSKHKHIFHVVAFDYGYYTTHVQTDTDDIDIYHHITFQKCSCGKRQFEYLKGGREAMGHRGITKARLLWEEKGKLQLTKLADVYDDNYSCTKQYSDSGIWEYQPITEIGKIMNMMRDNEEFQELCTDHQMVEDAWGELETVIKLHENIDTSD